MTIAKICNILGFSKSKHVKFRVLFAAVKKKSLLWARVMARTVQLLGYDMYCPITLSQPIRFENFVIVMMIIIIIRNGNRTEWSIIQGVIRQASNFKF